MDMLGMQFIEEGFRDPTGEKVHKFFREACTRSCKAALLEFGELPPLIFFLIRMTGTDDYNVSFSPVLFENDEDKTAWANKIKTFIKTINSLPFASIVSSIFISEAWMSEQLVTEENKDLEHTYKNFMRPSEDPKRKEVLLYSIETPEKGLSLTYEFIKSDDGDIVISEEPTHKSENGGGVLSNFFDRK